MKRVSTILVLGIFSWLSISIVFADGPGLGNLTYNSGELFNEVARFTSTNGAPRGHGFVAMQRGYLAVTFANDGGGGNGSGGFAFYDVSNPRSPVLRFTTENNPLYTNPAGPNYAGNFTEAHGFGFSGNYVCFPWAKTGASGVEFWDWSNIDPPNPAPAKVGSISLPALTGGDYEPTPWWSFWQGGRYVYVAGTSAGLYIVDASNPAAPVLVNRGGGLPNPIPTSQTGGFRVNTVLAIGNLLVIAGSDVSGIATFDIGDPRNPVLLKTTPNNAVGYSMMVNGNKILGANDPAVVWDISDPANITLIGSGPNVADRGGYGTFQDGYFQYGSSSAYVKLKVDTYPFTVAGVSSPSGFGDFDFDFATALGNLIFLGNDHGTGSPLLVHQLTPDTNGPNVNMVNPKNNAVNQALTTRVGLTFTDLVDLRTVTTSTFIVRPAGGSALPGRYSHQTGIVNFWPDQPLQQGITYQVSVPVGGIRDYAGNSNSVAFFSTFTTASTNAPLFVTASKPPPANPGQPVNFSASASSSGAQFSWDFGDGTPPTPFSISSNATHVYIAPGHFPVTVTAINGGSQASASLVQTIYRPLTPVRPAASDTIIFDAPSNRVWSVNADSDTVTIIHATNFTKLLEKPVGQNPRTLAQAPDGTIWVVNQGSATISVLNRANGNLAQTILLPRASRPYGIGFAPNGGAAYVTLQGTGHLLRLDPATRAITGDLSVGPTPRGVAISGDSQRILVTRFISPDTSGEVVEVNAGTFTVTRTFTLAIDTTPDEEDNGRGLPNYLSSITISPDGQRAWIPSKKDNIQRGLYRDGLPLTFESTVRTIISQLDLVLNAEALSARVDLNDTDLAFAAQFSPLGDYVFVAVQGDNAVNVFDAYSGARKVTLQSAGLAPQGLVLNSDGSRLFVNNFMSRNVAVYDISGIVASTNDVAPLLATISTVTNELLSPQVLLGKQIFYNAKDDRMSRDHYISCASCHLDGDHDGRVWDFTDRGEGFRNTIALAGRKGMGHGRVHWSANFDEIQDFENDIRGPFGGDGFMSDALFNAGTRSQPLGDPKTGLSPELDALAAYVSSLTNVHPSPYRNADGTLTTAGGTGKTIFQSLNCASCHTGNQFTDSAADVLHDVGTIKPSSGQRLGQPLTGIDTPTLKGIWETAPYFHDGSASTLADVFVDTNAYHGALAGALTPTQKQQLVAYLQQIDESEIVNTPPTVWLSSPGEGTAFTLPTNIVLTAQAADADGIRKVEFFANGISLGQATNPPFSIVWSNAVGGDYWSNGAAKYYQLTARAQDNQNDSTFSAPVNITVSQPGIGYVRINFQTANAPIPSGYYPDYGDVFGPRADGFSYGWNAPTPDTRWRTSEPDVRYATLIHLQKPANPDAVWEISLPNGSYGIYAVSGDADFYTDYFDILAEGVTILNGSPSVFDRFVEGSNTVSVTDGRLTVGNGPSASNNKICFIEIIRFGVTATPPPAEVSIDLGSPNNLNGMTHPQSGDGNTTAVTIGGRSCRQNVNPSVDLYSYFGVSDAFAYRGSRPDLYVVIDYFDTGTGSLGLQYDSDTTGGNLAAKYKDGGSVALTGSNTWKQKVFHVTDAWFGNQQNAGADFRIYKAGGGFFYLDRVRVLTSQPAAPLPIAITSISFQPGGNTQIDFAAGGSDTIGAFTLQSSSTVNGTYADVSATTTTLGAGSFRAVLPPNGSIQFYRIRR